MADADISSRTVEFKNDYFFTCDRLGRCQVLFHLFTFCVMYNEKKLPKTKKSHTPKLKIIRKTHIT